MNTIPVNSVAAEINRLHEEAKRSAVASRQALNGALSAAWHAGQLLLAEKKRVQHGMGRGAWLLWLEANFRGSPRTAQRYMKLTRSATDVAFLQGMSLRQAYARLGIATEPKTSGCRLLAYRLPSHVVLANKLLRALKRQRSSFHGDPRVEIYRRDLRGLFEVLHPWFVEPESRNVGGLPILRRDGQNIPCSLPAPP